MNASIEHDFSQLCRMAHPDISSGLRSISVGDELQLTPGEQAQLQKSVMAVRRASGAARMIARHLLQEAGAPAPWDLCKQASGAPRWPDGFIGSLAHDSDCAIAVVARNRALRSIGVDIEPATPLPADLLDIVATGSEKTAIGSDLLKAKWLFCIKEATYKAANPIDGEFLDHHDVEFDFSSNIATTKNRIQARIHTLMRSKIIVLAVVQ